MKSIISRMSGSVAILSLVAGPSSLGQVTYSGRDTPQGTGWRAAAQSLINQNRKADLVIEVHLPNGTPVPDALVQVSMKSHGFNFGSAVDPRYFLESQPDFYNDTYATKVTELFNTATPENHLKWRAWAGDFGDSFLPAVTQEGLNWLDTRGIEIRGHALMWPRYQSVPNDVRALLDIPNPSQQDLQAIYDATNSHISDIANAVEGKVFAWDALNEPRTSNDIEEALTGFTPSGESTIIGRGDLRARWFNVASAADPTATLFVNDFQVIPGGGLADDEPDRLMTQLDDMISNGAVVEGIGFQSHFNDDVSGAGKKLPTGPVAVWDLLDEFQGVYDLPIHISEFDFDTSDLSLQADYTRDFMTAVFAHESIEAFVFWGFWEGKMANPQGALFETDWSIKPNGQAFLDLVFDEWWTDEEGLTDDDGELMVRGFFGEYDVTVMFDGEVYEFDGLELDADGLSTSLVIDPGFLDADFNEDGMVGLLDLDILGANWQLTGATKAQGDANGDGLVSLLDLDLLGAQWQSGSNFSAALTASGRVIPQPGVVSLVGMAVLLLTSHRPGALRG